VEEEQRGLARRQVGQSLAGSIPGAAEMGGHGRLGARAGEEGRGRVPGAWARWKSSFFDLIRVISNGIDLIQINDGLPEI
jgi:hypothetical protein